MQLFVSCHILVMLAGVLVYIRHTVRAESNAWKDLSVTSDFQLLQSASMRSSDLSCFMCELTVGL